jgi:hypothetical protein
MKSDYIPIHCWYRPPPTSESRCDTRANESLSLFSTTIPCSLFPVVMWYHHPPRNLMLLPCGHDRGKGCLVEGCRRLSKRPLGSEGAGDTVLSTMDDGCCSSAWGSIRWPEQRWPGPWVRRGDIQLTKQTLHSSWISLITRSDLAFLCWFVIRLIRFSLGWDCQFGEVFPSHCVFPF